MKKRIVWVVVATLVGGAFYTLSELSNRQDQVLAREITATATTVQTDVPLSSHLIIEKEALPTFTVTGTEAPNDVASSNDVSAYPDTYELEGTMYERVTDSKFGSYIDVAHQYGGEFYAIPNSDCFILLKGDEVIFSMSTGVKAVSLEYPALLTDILEKTNLEAELPGVIDTVGKVLETGEAKDVTLGEYAGYYVSIEDEWLVVSF